MNKELENVLKRVDRLQVAYLQGEGPETVDEKWERFLVTNIKVYSLKRRVM